MNIQDRTLLEDSARAAGYVVLASVAGSTDKFWKGADWGLRIEPMDWVWNPLTDDGDALRLVVTLKMDVDCAGDEGVEVIEWEISRTHAFEPFGSDPYAATRLAITRCAAEIGRNMK